MQGQHRPGSSVSGTDPPIHGDTAVSAQVSCTFRLAFFVGNVAASPRWHRQHAMCAKCYHLQQMAILCSLQLCHRHPPTACPAAQIVIKPRAASAHACRALIPMHRDLRLSGQLPPLDAPHHMRATEWGEFREGVVISSAPSAGSLLDVGLDKAQFH